MIKQKPTSSKRKQFEYQEYPYINNKMTNNNHDDKNIDNSEMNLKIQHIFEMSSDNASLTMQRFCLSFSEI